MISQITGVYSPEELEMLCRVMDRCISGILDTERHKPGEQDEALRIRVAQVLLASFADGVTDGAALESLLLAKIASVPSGEDVAEIL